MARGRPCITARDTVSFAPVFVLFEMFQGGHKRF